MTYNNALSTLAMMTSPLIGGGVAMFFLNTFVEKDVKVSNLTWKFTQNGREVSSFSEKTSLGHLKDCVTLGSKYDTFRIEAVVKKQTVWQSLTGRSAFETRVDVNNDHKLALQQMRCIENCRSQEEFLTCVAREKWSNFP